MTRCRERALGTPAGRMATMPRDHPDLHRDPDSRAARTEARRGCKPSCRPRFRDAAGPRASRFTSTLAFLGDVRNRDLNEICQAVAAAAEPFEPFELQLEGLGAFPSLARPRVLWAGVTAPDLKPLLDLREAVVARRREAGYRPDDQRFHPHVTLGRIKPDRGGRGDLTASDRAVSRLVRRARSRSPKS